MKFAWRTVEWKYREVREDLPELKTIPRVRVHGPEDIVKHYAQLFSDKTQELFAVFCLSSSHNVLGFEIVTKGTLNSSLVHPREVFRFGIVSSAAAIIVAHNHPSGNHEPSQEDIAVTRQLVDAGKTIGIPVHDHLIFADGAYTSMAERGLI